MPPEAHWGRSGTIDGGSPSKQCQGPVKIVTEMPFLQGAFQTLISTAFRADHRLAHFMSET